MIRQKRPEATVATTRLEAFTDGVFAIAATLLVLDLTAHGIGEVSSDAQLWAALGGMWLEFLTFALSFVLLCLLWMTHVQQFSHIARVDGTMIWLNNLRLLFVVLVPFATSLTTDYSDYIAGRMMMPATFFFAILCSWLQWTWAVGRRAEMLPDLSDAEARGYGRAALSALLIAGVVLAASPLIGSAAFLLFLFDGPLTRALGGRGDRAAASA